MRETSDLLGTKKRFCSPKHTKTHVNQARTTIKNTLPCTLRQMLRRMLHQTFTANSFSTLPKSPIKNLRNFADAFKCKTGQNSMWSGALKVDRTGLLRLLFNYSTNRWATRFNLSNFITFTHLIRTAPLLNACFRGYITTLIQTRLTISSAASRASSRSDATRIFHPCSTDNRSSLIKIITFIACIATLNSYKLSTNWRLRWPRFTASL